MKNTITILLAIAACASPQGRIASPSATAACHNLNNIVVSSVMTAGLPETERILRTGLANDANLESLCAGAILNNVAAALAALGQFSEAQRFAERSIGSI